MEKTNVTTLVRKDKNDNETKIKRNLVTEKRSDTRKR